MTYLVTRFHTHSSNS